MLINIINKNQKAKIRLKPKDKKYVVSFKESQIYKYEEYKFEFKISELLGVKYKIYALPIIKNANNKEFFIEPKLEGKILNIKITNSMKGLYTLYEKENKILANNNKCEFSVNLIDYNYLFYNDKIVEVNDLEINIILDNKLFFSQIKFYNEHNEQVYPKLIFLYK